MKNNNNNINTSSNKLIKILISIVLILYPFIIFYVLSAGVSSKIIGICFLFLVIVHLIRDKKLYIFILGCLLVVSFLYFKNDIFLKLYPVIMNVAVLTAFYFSLKTTPIIEIFATKLNIKPIDHNYCRVLTKLWCYLLLFNSCVSFITVFLSLKIWTIYNGFISYILMGTLFIGEYIYRKIRK